MLYELSHEQIRLESNRDEIVSFDPDDKDEKNCVWYAVESKDSSDLALIFLAFKFDMSTKAVKKMITINADPNQFLGFIKTGVRPSTCSSDCFGYRLFGWLDKPNATTIRASFYHQDFDGLAEQYRWPSKNNDGFQLLGFSQNIKKDELKEIETGDKFNLQAAIFLFKEESSTYQIYYLQDQNNNPNWYQDEILNIKVELQQITGYASVAQKKSIVSPRYSFMSVFYQPDALTSEYELAVVMLKPFDIDADKKEFEYDGGTEIATPRVKFIHRFDDIPEIVGFIAVERDKNSWEDEGPEVFVTIRDGTKLMMFEFKIQVRNICVSGCGGGGGAVYASFYQLGTSQELYYQYVNSFTTGTPLKFFNWMYGTKPFEHSLFYSYEIKDQTDVIMSIGFNILPAYEQNPADQSPFCLKTDVECNNQSDLTNSDGDICLFQEGGNSYVEVVGADSTGMAELDPILSPLDAQIERSIPSNFYDFGLTQDDTGPFIPEEKNFYQMEQSEICQIVNFDPAYNAEELAICAERLSKSNDFYLFTDSKLNGLAPSNNCRVNEMSQVYANVTQAAVDDGHTLLAGSTVWSELDGDERHYYLDRSNDVQYRFGYVGFLEFNFYTFTTLMTVEYNLILLKDCQQIELEPIYDGNDKVYVDNGNQKSATINLNPFIITNNSIRFARIYQEESLNFICQLRDNDGVLEENSFISMSTEVNPDQLRIIVKEDYAGIHQISLKTTSKEEYIYYDSDNTPVQTYIEYTFTNVLEVQIFFAYPPYFDPEPESTYAVRVNETSVLELPPIFDLNNDKPLLTYFYSQSLMYQFTEYQETISSNFEQRQFVFTPWSNKHAGLFKIMIILQDDVENPISQPNLQVITIRVMEPEPVIIDDVIVIQDNTNADFVGKIAVINQDGQLQISLTELVKHIEEVESKVVDITQVRINYQANKLSEEIEPRDSEDVQFELVSFTGRNLFTFQLDYSQTYFGKILESIERQETENDEDFFDRRRLQQADEISIDYKFTIEVIMTDTSIFESIDNEIPLEPQWKMRKEIELEIPIAGPVPGEAARALLGQILSSASDVFFCMMGSSFAMNFFIAVSMAALWGTINVLQYIVYLPLITKVLPLNVEVLSKNLVDLTSFNIFDSTNLPEILFDFSEELEDSSYNESFEFIDISSISIIVNLGFEFYVLMGLLIGAFLKLIIILVGPKLCNCIKKRILDLKDSHKFIQIFIRVFLEIYLDACLTSAIRLSNFWIAETSSDRFDQTVTLFIAAMCVICPLLSYWILRKGYKNNLLQNKNFKKRYGELYVEINTNNFYSTQWHSFFMVRRFLIMLFNFKITHLQFKTELHLIFCYIYMGFGFVFQPFEEKINNTIFMINMILTTFIVSTYFCYSGYTMLEDYEVAGWLGITLTGILLLINMAMLVYIQLSSCVTHIKRVKRIWRYRVVKKYHNCRYPERKRQLDLLEQNLKSIMVGSDLHKQQKLDQSKVQDQSFQQILFQKSVSFKLENSQNELEDLSIVAEKPQGKYKYSQIEGEFYPHDQIVWKKYRENYPFREVYQSESSSSRSSSSSELSVYMSSKSSPKQMSRISEQIKESSVSEESSEKEMERILIDFKQEEYESKSVGSQMYNEPEIPVVKPKELSYLLRKKDDIVDINKRKEKSKLLAQIANARRQTQKFQSKHIKNLTQNASYSVPQKIATTPQKSKPKQPQEPQNPTQSTLFNRTQTRRLTLNNLNLENGILPNKTYTKFNPQPGSLDPTSKIIKP